MVFTRKRKLKFAKKIVEKQQNVVKPAASDLERNIPSSLYFRFMFAINVIIVIIMLIAARTLRGQGRALR